MNWDLRPWHRSRRSARHNHALRPSVERLENVRLLNSGSQVVSYDNQGDKFILDYNSRSVLIRAEEDYVNGNIAVATYDNNGKLTGKSLTEHDASGNLITTSVNASGALVGVGVFYTNGNISCAFYDGHNNVTGHASGHKYSSGAAFLNGYDPAGKKTYSLVRNASGDESLSLYGDNGSLQSTSNFTTDAQGDKLYYVFDAQGKLTKYEEDYVNGNVLTESFISGAMIGYSFSTTDAQGDRFHYSFAPNGTRTHYEEDLANGNIYAVNYANGAVVGSGVEMTDASGDKLIGLYNNQNVLVYSEKITPDGKLLARDYDSNGKLVATDYEFQDSSGNTILYESNSQRVLNYFQETEPNGAYVAGWYTNGVLTGTAVVTRDSSGNLICTKRDAKKNVTSISVASFNTSGQLFVRLFSPQGTLISWALYNPDGSIAAASASASPAATIRAASVSYSSNLVASWLAGLNVDQTLLLMGSFSLQEKLLLGVVASLPPNVQPNLQTATLEFLQNTLSQLNYYRGSPSITQLVETGTAFWPTSLQGVSGNLLPTLPDLPSWLPGINQ